MSFAKMKFFIAFILLAASAAVQGRSVQAHPIISMLDYRTGLDTRIIDGQNAEKGLLPWHALLIMEVPEGQTMCGGSLISEKWILTAAHCVINATNVQVSLGGVHLWIDAEYNYISDKFLFHEDYVPSTFENDVGLVELPVPATLSENVQIIPLPARSQPDPAGSTVRVSGNGKTRTDEISMILQWADMTAMKNDVCVKFFPGFIFPSTLCAHGVPYHSPCTRDSGGALVQYTPDAVQVGVVSSVVKTACAFGYPSVYARVTSFLDWINQHTGIPVLD